MRKTIAVVVLIPLGLWSIVCNKRSSTAPSAPSSAPGAAIISIAIQGPSTIAPGERVQFTAIATFSDRTNRNYTKDVKWVSYPRDVLTISETGEAVAVTAGEASVSVDFPTSAAPGAACGAGCHAVTRVMVLPPNTYRLTGKVLESELPVQGATVAVVSGISSGVSSTSDYAGQYRLYGVVGAAQIKVTKPGYQDIVKDVIINANEVLDFPEARQIAGVPSMSGTYTLTLQADNDCSTAPSDFKVPPLPADARQRRTYTAQVAQEGPSLSVTLAAPQFAPPSHDFFGRIHPATLEFVFGDGYLGYGPDNGITERVSATQAITFEGYVHAERSGSALIGALDGEIQVFDVSDSGSGRPIYRLIGDCRAPNHRFTMTPSTGRLR